MCIKVRKGGPIVSPESCDGDSVLRLRPHMGKQSWLSNDIVGTAPALMKAPAKDSAYAGAYMISSRIYDQHLKHNDFSGARKWVKDVQKDRPWSFGIPQKDHWIAVVVDWKGKWIRCY